MTHQEHPARILSFPQGRRLRQEQPAGAAFPGATLDAYHLLAQQGELSPDQLAATLQLAREQAQAIVAELASLKLVRETEDGTLIAIPHSQAVDELLAEQSLLLAHALEHLSEGRRRLRTVVENRGHLDPSEASRISSTMLGGTARRGMFEVSREAAETISALHPGGAFSDELLQRSLSRAVENLRRGIRMRVVHQSSALGHPSVVAYLSELSALGCRVRLRDNLPFRMLLIDGTLAICSVPASGSYSLQGERVMALLVRIFETTWVDAVPLETALAKTRRLTAPDAVRTPAGGVDVAGGTGSGATGWQVKGWDAGDSGAGAGSGARPGDITGGHATGADVTGADATRRSLRAGRPAAGRPEPGQPGPLGPAHEAILRLLAEGQTDQAIAHSLGINPRTVTRRISEIYDALGVESRFQAGIAAKELGIV